MVSLRRKIQSPTSGGKRRSARLLALEGQKCEKVADHMLSIETAAKVFENSMAAVNNRRGRTKKIKAAHQESNYYAQEVATNENGNSSGNSSADRIIEYVLDVLELKDTNELFTMPDDIQINDYSERVNKPGDFATLRQKHKDGMYKTLEQFENDVYMVFRRAMAINSRDTIPYREAMCLQDQAKQLFQSLKNNRTYSELELSAWHQKYFTRRKRAARDDGDVGTSRYAAKTQRNVRSKVRTDVKQGNVATGERGNRRRQSTNDKSKLMRKIQPTTTPIDRTRKDSSESSKSTMEQRRDTYKAGSGSISSTFSISHKQHGRLARNNNAPSYQESLRRFVRNAGIDAKIAAEQRCREYVERVKAHLLPAYLRESITNYNTGFLSLIGGDSTRSSGNDVASSSATRPCSLTNSNRYFGNFGSLSSTTTETNSTSFGGKDISPHGTDNALVPHTIDPLNKKLETDGLLRLFCLIGTPEFSERSKSIFASSSSTENKPEQSFRSLLAADDGCSSKNQEKQSKSEQLKQTATYNSSPRNSKLEESGIGMRKGASKPEPQPEPSPFRKGMLPSHLGFGHYARSIQPFKMRSDNPFAAPHGA